MPETFELHFRYANGDTRRRVLTCRMAEVMDLARQLLVEERALEVEVRSHGQHVFKIAA
jgi:hypothetical protein